MCGGFILGLMIRIAILVDGGHLRVFVRSAGYKFDPDYIEKVALACADRDDPADPLL
jgi:hypothetical protein